MEAIKIFGFDIGSKHYALVRGVLIDFILLQSFLHPRWNILRIAWFCLCIC